MQEIISARGFCQRDQQAFYDKRVFYSNNKRYHNVDIQKWYELNEKEKKKTHNEQRLTVEQGTCTHSCQPTENGKRNLEDLRKVNQKHHKNVDTILCRFIMNS